MSVALIAVCFVFVFCEALHYKREQELIRRLASRNEDEYQRNYETKQDTAVPSPAREAMRRWKKGE